MVGLGRHRLLHELHQPHRLPRPGRRLLRHDALRHAERRARLRHRLGLGRLTLTLTPTPTPTPTPTRTPALTLTLTLTRWVGRALLRSRPQGEEVAGFRLRGAPGLLQLHREPRDFPPSAWRAAGRRPVRAFPPRAPEPRARTRRRHTGECPDKALHPNPNPSTNP